MDIDFLRHFLMVMGLSVVRLATACSIAPFLGANLLQGRVRNSIMFSLGVILYPVVAPTIQTGIGSPLMLVVILIKEIVLGLLLGFLAGIVFWAAMSVGFFIDCQRGASMASVMDPMHGEETTPLGQFLLQAMVVLFYSGGGFLFFLGSLFESYLIWPISSHLPTFGDAFPGFILEQADSLMRMTVVLAAPVIIAMFLCELALGLINRFSPMTDVFFLAMPIKSLIAVLVLILYMPFLFHLLAGEVVVSRGVLEVLKGFVS